MSQQPQPRPPVTLPTNIAKNKPMLETTAYLKLEPTYNTRGLLSGVNIAGVTKSAPKSGPSIRLKLKIPRGVFDPWDVTLTVDESTIGGSPQVIAADLSNLLDSLDGKTAP